MTSSLVNKRSNKITRTVATLYRNGAPLFSARMRISRRSASRRVNAALSAARSISPVVCVINHRQSSAINIHDNVVFASRSPLYSSPHQTLVRQIKGATSARRDDQRRCYNSRSVMRALPHAARAPSISRAYARVFSARRTLTAANTSSHCAASHAIIAVTHTARKLSNASA